MIKKKAASRIRLLLLSLALSVQVVISTTKVMNFEQITTNVSKAAHETKLSFLPQR